MTKFFWQECDPVLDGHLVASAITLGSGLPAPAQRGADRVTRYHETLTQSRGKTDIEAFALECQALTLACHAGQWVSLMQMFGSQAAVIAEMNTYTERFAETLNNDLGEIADDRFLRPQDPARVQPWVEALGAYGEVWADGHDRGRPAPEMMQTLWLR